MCFCALSVSSRCLGVTQRPVPRSPDFPRPPNESETATARRPGETNGIALGRKGSPLCLRHLPPAERGEKEGERERLRAVEGFVGHGVCAGVEFSVNVVDLEVIELAEQVN